MLTVWRLGRDCCKTVAWQMLTVRQCLALAVFTSFLILTFFEFLAAEFIEVAESLYKICLGKKKDHDDTGWKRDAPQRTELLWEHLKASIFPKNSGEGFRFSLCQ